MRHHTRYLQGKYFIQNEWKTGVKHSTSIQNELPCRKSTLEHQGGESFRDANRCSISKNSVSILWHPNVYRPSLVSFLNKKEINVMKIRTII
jgi:hypothetical protein